MAKKKKIITSNETEMDGDAEINQTLGIICPKCGSEEVIAVAVEEKGIAWCAECGAVQERTGKGSTWKSPRKCVLYGNNQDRLYVGDPVRVIKGKFNETGVITYSEETMAYGFQYPKNEEAKRPPLPFFMLMEGGDFTIVKVNTIMIESFMGRKKGKKKKKGKENDKN